MSDYLAQLDELLDEIRRRETVERNLAEVLNLRGLSVGTAMSLIGQATEGFQGPDPNAPTRGSPKDVSWSTVQALGRLHFMHSFTSAELAEMCQVPVEWVEECLSRSDRSVRQAEVIGLHLDGLTVADISTRLGLHKYQVYRWLEEAELQPNTKASTRVGPETILRVVELWSREGEFYSYDEIADMVGLTTQQVLYALRVAHRKGILPDYGQSGLPA